MDGWWLYDKYSLHKILQSSQISKIDFTFEMFYNKNRHWYIINIQWWLHVILNWPQEWRLKFGQTWLPRWDRWWDRRPGQLSSTGSSTSGTPADRAQSCSQGLLITQNIEVSFLKIFTCTSCIIQNERNYTLNHQYGHFKIETISRNYLLAK